MSHPNSKPASTKTVAFPMRIKFQTSRFFFSRKYTAMKSVPPVEVPPIRHKLIAAPLIRPPNTLISRMSCVIGMAGTISVNTLVATMIRAVLSVKRLPIARKLKIAGIAFSARLIGENGNDIPKKR